MPNWWEEVHGLNINSPKNDFSDSNLDKDKDGYTQLEDYLNWSAQPHYFVVLGDSKVISLKNIYRGYEKNPVYSFSDVKNGEVHLNGDEVQFKATQKGLASFKITVIDAEEDSMTRVINLFIK